MHEAGRFAVTKRRTNLIQAFFVGRNQFFHPDFGARNQVVGLRRRSGRIAGRQKIGLKNFEAGLWNKVGRQERRERFEVIALVKK